MCFVAYWWCSRTCMSWLVYLQKMCGMFCRVVKKDYHNCVTFGTKQWIRSLKLKNRPQKWPFISFNYDEIWPFWVQIGQISLKIITGVKFHLIVLRPPGRDITSQLCASVCQRDFAICSSRLRYMQYRVQHVIIHMDKIHMIYSYAKTSDTKTQSIRKDHGFGKDPREKINVLMHSIQHLLIYNECNHMLNIADINIYLYQ